MTTYVTVTDCTHTHSQTRTRTHTHAHTHTRAGGAVTDPSRRLLGVDVHVLRVRQQADPLLLLPLFGHLKRRKQ